MKEGPEARNNPITILAAWIDSACCISGPLACLVGRASLPHHAQLKLAAGEPRAGSSEPSCIIVGKLLLFLELQFPKQ